jgi:protein SCO1/2
MPSVTLTDTRGRRHPLREEARGRVTLLFLGYTHCPDVCPVQMANLGAVLDELSPSVRRRLQVVFVTVDPARDTAARIRSWLDRFGDGFVGLRGSQREIAALQDSLRLPRAARQDRRVQGRYTVGHASQVLAFGPDARARLAYPSGTRQRAWRDDLPRLVREAVDADPAGGG